MKTSLKAIIATFLLIIISNYTQAQVGIGTTSPDGSAKLDISSTSKGLLPPRMSYAQRNAISSPVAGLTVWCNNCGPFGEMQVYNGTSWTNMIGGLALAFAPTVSATTAVSSITRTTAISGGNVSADGDNPITARGICWSTNQNPTIADAKTTESGTTGTFTSNLTGLSSITTYYVRAYATNASGTSYGPQATFTSGSYSVGDANLGGIIAYIYQAGDPGYIANQEHGLVVTSSNVSGGTEWGCDGTTISGADATALGTGNLNTNQIVSGCASSGIAAKLCQDLVQGGYSDWFLPSSDELAKIYLNRVAIGGLTSNVHWTSTEASSGTAWILNFNDGIPNPWNKGANYVYVRAVRYF
jgi:hypothetical protein